MVNVRSLRFLEVTAIDAVQMEGVALNYCDKQLSHFQDSCRLMMSVVSAPSFLTATLSQWSEACTRSMSEVYGNRMDNLTEGLISVTAEEKQKQISLSNKYMGEIVSMDMDGTNGPPHIRERMIQAYLLLDQLVGGFGEPVFEMFGNLLKALTIQAWATFEAMTKELWQSVNESSNSSFARPTGVEWTDKRLGFDARNKIRDTFAFSFKDDPLVMKHLERKCIDPLALLRNLLVHHGGKVDAIFKRDAAYHDSLKQFSLLNDGAIIPFSGPMVVSVIQPAISSGYNLIASVDDWIKRNP